MKNKFFKTLAIFGLSVIAWNCSDDPATSAQHTSETPVVQPKDAFEVDINCWMLNIGTQTLLIMPDALGTYTVTDPFSIPYGTYDVATGTIYDLNGNVVITNVDTSTLPILSTDKTVTYLDGTRLAIVNGELVPLSNGIKQLLCLQSGHSGRELQLRQDADPDACRVLLFSKDRTACRKLFFTTATAEVLRQHIRQAVRRPML